MRCENYKIQKPLSTWSLHPKFEPKTLGIATLWTGVRADIAIKDFAMTRSLQPAAAHHRHSYIKILNNSPITEFLVIFIKIRSAPAAFWEETPLSGVPALLRSNIVSLYNHLHYLVRSQKCAGALGHFTVSEPHSGTLWSMNHPIFDYKFLWIILLILHTI